MSSATVNTELSKLRIDKSRKHKRRSPWLMIMIVVVVIGALGGGGYFYFVANAAIPVKVASAERIEGPAAAAGAQPMGSAVLTATGYVIPRHVVEVSSKIVGRIVDMPVSRGDKVKAGDVLIRIEDQEQQAQVRMAEAKLANTQARLDEMKAGSRPQEIMAAKAAIASAKATLDNSESDLKRQQDLAAENVVSKQELDRAQAAFRVAQANMNSAEQNEKLLETWPRPEQLHAVEAQQREDAANLAYAKTQLDETIIHAPISGVILEKVAEKGELVTNQNFGGERGAKSSVVSMADLKDLQVELDINESDLPKIHMHQPCEARTDSAPDHPVKGEVDEIAPQADRQKGTVQVKVRLIDPADDVLPEVNARVTFMESAKAAATNSTLTSAPTTAASPPRVLVPKTAIVTGDKGSMVYIAADGVAVARSIKVGIDGPRGTEVLEGLAGNELLITEPLDKIKNGTRVAVPS